MGPYDPRSLVPESQREIKCNVRLVLGDEDKASFSEASMRPPSALLSAILRKQEAHTVDPQVRLGKYL